MEIHAFRLPAHSVSKVSIVQQDIDMIPKARDQKQIYRLNETMSHWGLNPPPSRMRHLKIGLFVSNLFPCER